MPRRGNGESVRPALPRVQPEWEKGSQLEVFTNEARN